MAPPAVLLILALALRAPTGEQSSLDRYTGYQDALILLFIACALGGGALLHRFVARRLAARWMPEVKGFVVVILATLMMAGVGASIFVKEVIPQIVADRQYSVEHSTPSELVTDHVPCGDEKDGVRTHSENIDGANGAEDCGLSHR